MENIQQEIEAALANPVDQELMKKALAVKEEVYGTLPLKDAFYTLLLRIRELEKQGEQERWIPAAERVPSTTISCLMFDRRTETLERGYFTERERRFYVEGEQGLCEFVATHWKPINLPSN